MLQIFRNKAQSPVIQGIVLVIAVVFVFWGVGANMNSREAALVVNDEEISLQRFRQVYDQVVNTYSEQFGGSIPKGFLDTINVKQQVINKLIQETLLRQGATDMGIQVSSDEVQNEIRSMEQFLENGQFNMERYKAILNSNRLSPNKFELSIRHDMLSNKAIQSISSFGATITDFEVEDLYRFEKETVALKYIAVTPETFIDTISPSDDELQAFFDSSKEQYKTEPLVKLKYLLFTYEDLASQLTADDARVEKQYQQDIDKYKLPETRSASHILLTAAEKGPAEVHEQQRKKAEEIVKLARAGGDFAKLAKQYSEGPSKDNGGKLGTFGRGQMVPSFEKAVFSMQVGEISDVVKTKFGYHIIKLEGINPALTKPFEEVKETISKAIRLEQAKPLAFQKANSSYEGIISAGSLPAYSEAHPDMAVHETKLFSRSTPPAILAGRGALLDKAFDLKKGELSSLIETPAGYAILFAEDILAPTIPELGSVKADVLEDYKKAKADEKADEVARNLLASVKKGGGFEKEASTLGLTVKDSGPLLKGGDQTASTFPPSLVAQSFKLSVSSPYPEEPTQVGGAYYLFKFIERQMPKETLAVTDRKKYTEVALKIKSERLLSAWMKMARKESEIYTNKNI